MTTDKKATFPILTNIVTGFLGVGKTSAILNLLKDKPKNERWAILVNEFGEIGIDGNLFKGQHSQQDGVFVREVPGGCMCCASNLPMQMALNLLLAHAKPHRLIIEPTGLGHPLEVLQVLSEKHYQTVLSIQKVITLVDARKIQDTRYTEHEIFNQQIEMADILIANKQDLYQQHDRDNLLEYVRHKKTIEVVFTEQGRIDINLLRGKSQQQNVASSNIAPNMIFTPSSITTQDRPLPSCGYLKMQNQGEGYYSIGWRFAEEKTFDYQKLYSFLTGIQAERIKGVFITQQGVYAYNFSADTLNEMRLDTSTESCLEVITLHKETALEKPLLACLL